MGRFVSKGIYLLILVVPLLVIELTLRSRWPDNRNLVSDWYNFAFYFFFLIYGYLFAVDGALWEGVENNRRKYLLLGLFAFGMIYFGWHQPGINFLETFASGKYIFNFFKDLNILCWIFALLGYTRHYLSKDSPALRYANTAVYPFFILHQTVLIIIGFYVTQNSWNIVAKYITIIVGTFFFTLLIYEVLVRRVKVAGFFFGVK
jgi:hypothetical protein